MARWTARTEASGSDPAPGSGRVDGPHLRVCPNCGEARIGGFRFCRTCGLDYDIAERASGTRPVLLPDVGLRRPDLTGPVEGAGSIEAVERATGQRTPPSGPDAEIGAGRTITVGGGRYTITVREAAAVTLAIALVATAVMLFVATILR